MRALNMFIGLAMPGLAAVHVNDADALLRVVDALVPAAWVLLVAFRLAMVRSVAVQTTDCAPLLAKRLSGANGHRRPQWLQTVPASALSFWR